MALEAHKFIDIFYGDRIDIPMEPICMEEKVQLDLQHATCESFRWDEENWSEWQYTANIWNSKKKKFVLLAY